MYTNQQKVNAVCHVVKNQVPKLPEAQLMYRVFEQSLRDAYLSIASVTAKEARNLKNDARRYISGDMPHLEAIGIESNWVKRKIKDAGLKEFSIRHCKGE